MENLKDFINSNRNYRHDDCSREIVCKVFNRGNGRLALLRFYESEKTIVINKKLFNASDERKLKEFCRDNGMENWRWLYDELGCPGWYNRSLSIFYAKEKHLSEGLIVKVLVNLKCLGKPGRCLRSVSQQMRGEIFDVLEKRGWIDSHMNVKPSAMDVVLKNLHLCES